jgi:Cu(I)/Ag(I) efflux system membrane fusion protein
VRAPAFVERVAITRSNERVRAGQTLAWVYSPEIVRAQEELLVAQRWGHGEESLSVAATARERLVLLGMSARDIDAMLASGRAQRTVAVRAPMSGHVTAFEAVVGSYVTPDTRLYEITDFSRVRVVATPFTDDVSWLAPGVTARFVPRGGGAPVIVAFDLVEPGVTESTRTLRARFDPPRDASLRPGDIGELIVERPPRDAIVVPRDAVIDTGRARYVFVERRAGTFEPRRVELGALHGEERIITAGLEAGERVVARGAFVLDSESRLQAALAPSEGDAAKPAPHAHAHEASP